MPEKPGRNFLALPDPKFTMVVPPDRMAVIHDGFPEKANLDLVKDMFMVVRIDLQGRRMKFIHGKLKRADNTFMSCFQFRGTGNWYAIAVNDSTFPLISCAPGVLEARLVLNYPQEELAQSLLLDFQEGKISDFCIGSSKRKKVAEN